MPFRDLGFKLVGLAPHLVFQSFSIIVITSAAVWLSNIARLHRTLLFW